MKKLRGMVAAVAAFVCAASAFAGFGTGWPCISRFTYDDGGLITVVNSH
jgi:hypothetical protein